MRRLIYLTGAPGAGKSTLMREMTSRWTRIPAETGPVRDLLCDRRTCALEAVELGRRRPRSPGTDALGQSAIETMLPWMIQQRETDLVFAEGARLSNRRFLSTCATAGYTVILGYLEHAQIAEWRLARELALGHAQNPSWVAGRATAARNLAADPGPGVTVISGPPDTLRREIEVLIHERTSP